MHLGASVAHALIFAFLLLRYSRLRSQIPRGLFSGLVLVSVFLFRFLIEFLKERPAEWALNSPLSVVQRLRLPFVVSGAVQPSRLLPARRER